MRYLDKRIAKTCEELLALRKKHAYPVAEWQCKEGLFLTPQEAREDASEWKKFDSATMRWFGPDKHYWFATEYTVPEELDGKHVWLNIRTQIEEWDDGRNPQFLLFVNDKVTQGLDMNHREVRFLEKAVAGEKYQLDIQAYTGILHGEFTLIVEAWDMDMEINDLYFDLRTPLCAFDRLPEENASRMKLTEVMNETVNLLDLRTPYSEEFYASLKKAQAYIQTELYEKLTGYDDVIATCIGHTHIDVAWWWTVAQTREKVARSYATVLKLMEEYPNYKFMSSQPQLYVFLKERYPEVYERVKEMVRQKRWEPEGGMWVEADCNLTSGESLIRQFLYGKRFFKEEFGVDNRVLWLPDVFGYSGALPQIMKKCGIDYFMTTKLAWNQFNKVPYDTMMWRGIDGTEILTHLVTTLGVGQSEENFFTTYNGMLHPDAIIGGWNRYQNKDINNDILISYGYGDGGGGPTRDMLEMSKRMEKGITGIPKVKQGFSGEWFEKLEKTVSGNKRLPVWEGELYFEYHRGTLTSMGRNKRSNRKSELGLMDLELLGVLAKDLVAYPKEELDAMWKTVLLNQFHDILPGSSIHEVYEVTKKEYAEIAEKLEKLQQERLTALVPAGDGITVFNTTGFDRAGLIHVPADVTALVDTATGNVYPVSTEKDGAVAFVDSIPSKGTKTFAVLKEEREKAVPFTVTGNVLETPFYHIEFDEAGMMTRILEKESDREVLQEGKKANLLRMYEDKPMYYDNWDIDIFYTEKSWDADTAESVEWTEINEVRAVLTIHRKISNSEIRQNVVFYANDRRIDFETWVDWKEHQHLLKVHFPVAIHTDEATFEVQFGNLKRKVHQNTSWDVARFESCGQKWIDLSEGHYGVSLLNDCKYGHSVKDGNMALTLIKSGIEPNPVTDQEEHVFTYSLYPHKEDWSRGGTIREAYSLNQPLYAVAGGTPGQTSSAVSVDKENVVLETVKQAENGEGTIIRMYESHNSRTTAELTLGIPASKAFLCNMIEEVEQEIPVCGNKVKVTIKPYEAVTILVK